jgi:polyhydroxyalkanoate synthesis regulator phasin
MLGVTEIPEKMVGSVRQIWMGSVRQVWLAGLGAAAMAQEEGGKMFERLVKKGEHAEKEAVGKAESTWDNVSHRFDKQVASSLQRIGVPTRDEIATLTRRVDALITSVDRLRSKTPASIGAVDRGDDLGKP